MQPVIALLSGLIFGIGLIVSGMTNPAKIQNFLDLFGTWDPSLMFVMVGAIGVATIGFRVLLKTEKPFYAERFSWPTRTDIDAKLILGASLFGVGWGLSGYCPGPALVGVSALNFGTLVFVGGLLVGMVLVKYFTQPSKP